LNKKLLLIPLALLLALSLVVIGCPKPTEEVRLTLVSGWDAASQQNEYVKVFVDRVNEEGKGKVFIDYVGGPEVAPITEAVGLVRDDVYDMCMTTPGYYGGLCPPAVMLYYLPTDVSLLRDIGAFDIVDQFHRESMGIHFLGNATRGEKFTIVSKEPITSADFSGILMHTLPLYTTVLSYLGASTTTLSVDEFYVAMQTGVVDAIPLPAGTVSYDCRLYEVAKYMLFPLIPINGTGVILMNAETFDSLPADTRDLLTNTMLDIEPEACDYFTNVMWEYIDKQVAEGMEKVELPPEEAEKYLSAWTDYAWANWVEKNPVYGAQLYELCSPYLER
jgi:TRAP-type C4-dicarboxylate transport system substrate-binding protein